VDDDSLMLFRTPDPDKADGSFDRGGRGGGRFSRRVLLLSVVLKALGPGPRRVSTDARSGGL